MEEWLALRRNNFQGLVLLKKFPMGNEFGLSGQ